MIWRSSDIHDPMRFVLEPPQGVGDIRLGTAPSELAQIISRYGEVREFRRTPEAQPGWMISAPGLIFFVYRDSDGLVDAIEIARPEEPSKIQVTYRDINLFAEPASSVVERLEQEVWTSRQPKVAGRIPPRTFCSRFRGMMAPKARTVCPSIWGQSW